MMRPGYILIVLILLMDSCVDPVNLPIIRNANVMVVDGMITNAAGPQTVRLFYTSALDENVNLPAPVPNATVTITDDLGTVVVLSETSEGVYETDSGFSGVVGRTYTLNIQKDDGSAYESVPTLMKESGVIASVYQDFRENVLNDGDLTKPQDALYFYVDAQASDQTNLLRWRWRATYYVRTYPELVTRRIDGEIVPFPLPCSGYEPGGDGGITYVKPCTCCECWPVINSNTVAITQPQSNTDALFAHEYIGRVPVDQVYFYEKMVVEVDQLSVSDEVYQFWLLTKTQLEGAGSIFQPNIIKVRGNMRSVTDNNEEVFGVFSVSAVTTERLTITSQDIPKQLFPQDTIKSDCRLYYKASNQRPPFW
ncbi:MAG TPA: DUF4249 domain-containing protein [Ohtaekwangia sp.]